jgi:perosamine synthetase
VPHKWAFLHDEIGWNYRLPNINAALGVAQLDQLAGFVSAKRGLAHRYEEAFELVSGATFVREPEGSRSNYWLNAILLKNATCDARDAVLQATHDAGLLTRPIWTLMHRLKMYRDCPHGDLSISEMIERRLINLPSSAVFGMSGNKLTEAAALSLRGDCKLGDDEIDCP